MQVSVYAVFQFIENSKILHFKHLKEKSTTIEELSSTDQRSNIRSLHIEKPSKVTVGEIFHITIQIEVTNKCRLATILKHSASQEIIATSENVVDTQKYFIINILSPNREEVIQYQIDLYIWNGHTWVKVPSPTIPAFDIDISNALTLQLNVGIPNISVKIGDQTYVSSQDGYIIAEVTKGDYIITMSSQQLLSNTSRIVFVQWADGDRSPSKRITLIQSTVLTTLYKIQYYLEVQSEYGDPQGAGWYDENSLTAFSVSPSIIESHSDNKVQIRFFNGWTQDTMEKTVHGYINVNSPKTVRAEWITTEYNTSSEQNNPPIPHIILILLLILLLASFFIILRKKTHES